MASFFSLELSDKPAIEWDWGFKGRQAIRHPSIIILIIMVAVNISGAAAQTEAGNSQEVGGTAPVGGAFPGLKEINTMVDLSFMYTHFSGNDMRGSYTGLPQFGAGISFATSERTRFFFSARYGQKSGDPYHDIDGFSDPDGITVKALPIMFGMKINASGRQDFRLYVGGAFQYAFLWENVSTVDGSDNPQDVEASGTGPGYYLFMGPEFPLGQGGSALGVEFGYGGSKGDVVSGSHYHGVDLTGAHARIYFTFGI